MENGTLKNCLIELFCETVVLSGNFKRKSYEGQIQDTLEKFNPLLEQLKNTIETSDEALIEAASYVPAYVSELLADLSKRKKELRIIDYNMAMVSYFVPLMGKIESIKRDQFTDKIVELWNKEFPDNKIGKATAEIIQSGFKTSMSYITTAVCESLSRPDDCYELNLLRSYRDGYMMNTTEGAGVVREYYNIAPTIVRRISREEEADNIYRNIWEDYLKPCLHMIEDNKNEECQELYTKMVHDLEDKYLHISGKMA